MLNPIFKRLYPITLLEDPVGVQDIYFQSSKWEGV